MLRTRFSRPVDAGGRDRAVGRSAEMAPEIDGDVLLNGAAATGELVRARIVGAKGADLEAEVLEREDPERPLDAYPEVGRSPFAQKVAPQ